MSEIAEKIADAVEVALGDDGHCVVYKRLAVVAAIEAARQSAGQERGEAVAWLRKNVFRFNGDIEPQDDSEIPLYAHPPADSQRIAELEARLADAEYAAAIMSGMLTESREREERMREALRHGKGIVPGGLWISIELCAPNESPVKPGEYEDQYRFGWNACRAEVLRNMAALAAEKEQKE